MTRRSEQSSGVEVEAKLYFGEGCMQIPVWEIRAGKQTFYYEREHRKGYIPVGCLKQYGVNDDRTTISVLKAVQSDRPITILKKRDGFIAEDRWYVKADRSEMGVEKFSQCPPMTENEYLDDDFDDSDYEFD